MSKEIDTDPQRSAQLDYVLEKIMEIMALIWDLSEFLGTEYKVNLKQRVSLACLDAVFLM